MSHPLVQPRGEWMRDVLPDGEVARRVLAGQTELFELLVRRHNRRLYRTVRAIVHDDDEAEEVLQIAYVTAWQALGRFSGRGACIAWMARIAVRAARAAVERRRRRRDVEWVAAGECERVRLPAPGDRAEERELARLLERSLDALTEPYRTVFALRVIEGLSTDETASDLGLTPAAVKIRLHRAREKLRADLLARAERPEVLRRAWAFDDGRCDRVVAGVLAHICALPPTG